MSPATREPDRPRLIRATHSSAKRQRSGNNKGAYATVRLGRRGESEARSLARVFRHPCLGSCFWPRHSRRPDRVCRSYRLSHPDRPNVTQTPSTARTRIDDFVKYLRPPSAAEDSAHASQAARDRPHTTAPYHGPNRTANPVIRLSRVKAATRLLPRCPACRISAVPQ